LAQGQIEKRMHRCSIPETYYTMAVVGPFWFVISLLGIFQLVECSLQTGCRDSGCESVNSPDEQGHALLQVRTDAPMRRMLVSETESRGAALDVLPSSLFKLGIKLLGSESVLDELVLNTGFQNITYAGIPLTLRLVNGDMSNGTLLYEGRASQYGLESLDAEKKQNRINMVDLGGNYGTVSIAAYKNYPLSFRGIAVEPIPSTYFLLRWNMWLNGVPSLKESDLKEGSRTGILAFHGGVITHQRETIQTCYKPPETMVGHVCNCSFEPPGTVCHQVKGITMRSLVELFGMHPITMVKVDCEGCERSSLPVLLELFKEDPFKIHRVAGELHWPNSDLEKIACVFNSGKFFNRLCSTPTENVKDEPLACDADPLPCGGREHNQILERLENALNATALHIRSE